MERKNEGGPEVRQKQLISFALKKINLHHFLFYAKINFGKSFPLRNDGGTNGYKNWRIK